jgi:methionyl-tRNA synthetase
METLKHTLPKYLSGLCSMCMFGTRDSKSCEKCGETVCMHIYRSHHGKYCKNPVQRVEYVPDGVVRP